MCNYYRIIFAMSPNTRLFILVPRPRGLHHSNCFNPMTDLFEELKVAHDVRFRLNLFRERSYSYIAVKCANLKPRESLQGFIPRVLILIIGILLSVLEVLIVTQADFLI